MREPIVRQRQIVAFCDIAFKERTDIDRKSNGQVAKKVKNKAESEPAARFNEFRGAGFSSYQSHMKESTWQSQLE